MANTTQFNQEPELVAHERTYHFFNILIRWSILLIGDAILWLTLWFASPAGFLGATVAAVGVFILGFIFLIKHEEKQPIDPWAGAR